MNKSLKFVGIIVLLSVCSCSRTPKATDAPATRVITERVETTKQVGGRSYSGTVSESSGTVLSFSVAGTVCQIHVGVGDRVTKGELIATLDASNLEHTYQIALATLKQTQDAYDRMKLLHDSNSLPDIKWVEIENALSQAQNAAAIAKKGLDDANLYAPVSGYVSEKPVDIGMNVAPGMPVVKVVDINSVKVSIPVPEDEISNFANGSAAIISVGALNGKEFSGTMAEKGVVANPLSRTYEVKYEVRNPGGELLPGMICNVATASDSVCDIIAVPQDAVLLDADNQHFVWLASGNKVEKRVVGVDGMTAGSRIIISSGLSVGDSIIVSGQQKVSQGTNVINISK